MVGLGLLVLGMEVAASGFDDPVTLLLSISVLATEVSFVSATVANVDSRF